MPRPLAVRRHNEIIRRLGTAGSVSVAELAQMFEVSHETIRRDLKLLSGQGHLEVVHGGAARRGMLGSAPTANDAPGTGSGAAIGRVAVQFVPPNGSVLLDGGTATAAIALELARRSGLTICTNSLAHAARLCRVPGMRVFVLGGEVQDDATCGIAAHSGIDQVRVDVAFVSAAAFSEDGSLTDRTGQAADMRGRMLLTGRAFVVADRSALDARASFRVAHFDQAAGIIIDRAPDAALAAAWARAGRNIIMAG